MPSWCCGRYSYFVPREGEAIRSIDDPTVLGRRHARKRERAQIRGRMDRIPDFKCVASVAGMLV